MQLADAFLIAYDAAKQAIKPKSNLTVSEWADANRILSEEGSAEPGQWKTSRNPPMREIMDALSEHSKNEKVVFMKPSQWGGPLYIYTPIPTISGWKVMDTLDVGDVVFDERGRPTKITSVSPVFSGRECFEVVFSDGQIIKCDAAHLWQVDDSFPGHLGKKRGQVLPSKVISTLEIYHTFKYGNRNRYAIPVAQSLRLPDADFKISPYLLGYWLANGNKSGNQATCHEDDANEIAMHINQSGNYAQSRKMAWDKGAAGNIIFNLGAQKTGFMTEINALDLQIKHIPQQYLRASSHQRLELLQGLMDGDGSIGENGDAEFSNYSTLLINHVYELCVSLGLKPTIKKVARRGFSGKKPALAGVHYRMRFTAYADQPIFKLKRKLSRQKTQDGCRVTETKRRRIVDVVPCESFPVRCISVDSPNHLYLAGWGMIPTHNTEIGSNFIGYIISHAKGPAAVVMPTERSLNDWVSQKFDPMSKDTPCIAEELARKSNKSSDNNAQRKKFTGGIIYFKTAGSTAELKSTSLRYAVGDEIDEWEWSTNQGDPIRLLEIRLTAFHDSKLYLVSSPTMKDASHIEDEYLKGDQRQYNIACPHCGEFQTLKWANLRWEKDIQNKNKILRVFYACEHHGCVIEEHSKTQLLAGGKWIPNAPDNRHRSYHINGLYTPLGLGKSWMQLVYEWIDAQDDPKDLMVFLNTRLAESFADRSHDIKPNVLKARAEPYSLRTIPIGCLFLTAGIDTQDDRLEIQITGFGAADKTWPIDYHVIYGNPGHDEIWNALAEFLKNANFINHFGKNLRLEATAVDTGGHHTHKVYEFVRNAPRFGLIRVMACKGASTYGRAILGRPSQQDVNWKGQTIKKGVSLYLIGSDTAKHLLYNRLNGDSDKDANERKVHFSQSLDDNYFEGIVSETYNPRKNRWELKKGKRNETLDTWILSLAASMHPEIYAHKWRKSDWERIAAMIEPQKQAEPAKETDQPTVNPSSRKRRGVVRAK